MHSVVCVKQVPDTTEVHIDPKTNTLQRQGVPSILNPYDAHAVEAAVRLKEKYGGEVTLLSMGPPQAESALRKGLSFGADRAILLSDRAFAGADTLATSYTLYMAIEKIRREKEVDLVFCGKQAIDGDTAQVGPGIAVRLGWPQLTYVMEISDVDLEKREITVHRKMNQGREVVRSRLPALITVLKDLNELRFATFPDMLRSVSEKVTVWGLEDLGADREKVGLKGSPTAVSSIFPPPTRPGGEMIPGGTEDPEKAAAILVEKLIVSKVMANG